MQFDAILIAHLASTFKLLKITLVASSNAIEVEDIDLGLAMGMSKYYTIKRPLSV